ncbi:MAG: VOC family protein [Rhizobiaceae bacterium]
MNMHTKDETRFKAPVNSGVWFEIPVTDMDRARKFYSHVLMTEFTDMNDGPNPISIFGYGKGEKDVSGHLYPGVPAPAGTGPTVHLAVSDNLSDAMERVTSAGGSVVSPIIEIPAGRFAYCQDPDGNSISLFAI